MTCEEKISPPHILRERGQIIDLIPNFNGCYNTSEGIVHCSRSAIQVFSARERWWYVAISRCKPQNTAVEGISISYELTMTNGETVFTEQFSADEFYIFEVDIAFLCAFSLLMAISIFIAVKLHKKHLFHTTFKLYLTAVIFELFYLLVMCCYYGAYSSYGVENYGVKTFGGILDTISILVFLLMLLLMAKGYTITRGRISTSGSIKLAVFMTAYVAVYAALFFYEANYFDPGEVLYIYESPPGYGLVGLRLIAWMWFSYGVFVTLKLAPHRSQFYFIFFLFYTFWFWANPVVIFVANFALAKYVRATVVNGVERAIALAGLSFFTFLTWPSYVNKSFPFHIRTTQIGIMTNVADEPMNSHVYEVDEGFTNLAAISGTCESEDQQSRRHKSEVKSAETEGSSHPAASELHPINDTGRRSTAWAWQPSSTSAHPIPTFRSNSDNVYDTIDSSRTSSATPKDTNISERDESSTEHAAGNTASGAVNQLFTASALSRRVSEQNGSRSADTVNSLFVVDTTRRILAENPLQTTGDAPTSTVRASSTLPPIVTTSAVKTRKKSRRKSQRVMIDSEPLPEQLSQSSSNRSLIVSSDIGATTTP